MADDKVVNFNDVNRKVYELENVEFGEKKKMYSFRSPNAFGLMNAQKILGKSFNDVIQGGDLIDVCKFIYAVGPKEIKKDFVDVNKWLEYCELYDMQTCAIVFSELIKPLVGEQEETPLQEKENKEEE